MTTKEKQMWTSYSQSKDRAIRCELIDNYTPLVMKQAKKIKATLPDTIEFADLVQDGMIGLMQAIESYDLSKGKEFEAYAPIRIRGNMIDSIRSTDWVPRTVRTIVKKLELSVSKLSIQLKRKPKYHEIANDLDISVCDLKKWLKKLPPSVCEFSACFDVENNYEQSTDELFVSGCLAPSTEVEYRDLKAYMCTGLKVREKSIVNMYLNGYRNIDIAKALNVSASLISILKRPLLTKLKNKLTTVLN